MEKVNKVEVKQKRKKAVISVVSLSLVICMCIGIIAEYTTSGMLSTITDEHAGHNHDIVDEHEGHNYEGEDDTVYLVDNNLIMNGEVLFSNVTINENRELVLENGYILMENVMVDPDGTLYGKVNSISE